MSRWIVTRLSSGVIPLLFLAGIGAASPLCPGDCNLDRHVTTNEVVTAINIALGYAAPGACWGSDVSDVDEDGEITILDLLTSVATINRDCGPPPEYRFQVSEGMDLSHSPGPHLVLSVATVEEFDCGGYRIDGAVQVQGDSIDLTLGRIIPPSGSCVAVSDVANIRDYDSYARRQSPAILPHVRGIRSGTESGEEESCVFRIEL